MKPVILADPEERAAERAADDSWNDYLITEVEDDTGEEATVTVGDKLIEDRPGFGGWTTRMPWAIEQRPEVGMRIRVWSNGSQNHGVSRIVNGIYALPVYYKTKRERDAEWGYWVTKHQLDQREAFENGGRARLDELYETLPPALKRRIDRFRAEDPDFRWREEAYEMASCAEAGRLYRRAMDPEFGKLLKAHKVKGPSEAERGRNSMDYTKGTGRLDWPDTPEDRLIAFDAINSVLNGYKYDLQRELMPEMDDGHSGNTWGHAVKFAWMLIREGDEAKL